MIGSATRSGRPCPVPGGVGLVVRVFCAIPGVILTPARRGIFRSQPERIQIGDWRYELTPDGRLSAGHVVNGIVLAEEVLAAGAVGPHIARALGQLVSSLRSVDHSECRCGSGSPRDRRARLLNCLRSDIVAGHLTDAAQLRLVHRHNPPAEPPCTVPLDRGELVAPGQVGSGRSTVFDGEYLDIAMAASLRSRSDWKTRTSSGHGAAGCFRP